MQNEVVQSLVFMAGLGGVLAMIIVFARQKFHVEEDPRIDEVEANLPGNNCGACGQPGCRAFAETLVSGKENPSRCTVGTPEGKQWIAGYLGIVLEEQEKKVARLACAGGSHVARQRTRYVGEPTCRAASLTAGGGKGCTWGCLGLEDCGRACTFDAIHFNAHGLPVVDVEKCVACGDCVVACPKALFQLVPISHKLWVNCKSQDVGDVALAECDVACTACGKCVMDAGAGLLTMRHNLPVVDYALNDFADPRIIQRCPTGAIVWFPTPHSYETGANARKILRQSALPIG